MIDVLIVGAGPAGCSAALTARRRGLSVMMVFNGDGALGKAHRIDNYPGMPRVSGEEMLGVMRRQAESEGAQMKRAMVQQILPMDGAFSVLADNEVLEARSVILACGTARVKPLANEETYLGRGVSYCATCDGMFYKGKTMAVVGASAEAVGEANYLAELGGVVYLSERTHDTAGLSDAVEKIEGRPVGIEHENGKMRVITDKGSVEADGVFIFRPAVALTHLLPDVEVENGVVRVDREGKTNVPGVFACGDMTGGTLQITKAAGEGTAAALSADRYLKTLPGGGEK